MNIVVLVKEVPDMDQVKFDSERGVVDRSSAPAEMNPFDFYALQAAIDRKQEKDATVTVLTMGLPRAEKLLRDCYARGADRLILLTDKSFGGSDTYATAHTLAAAIQKLGDIDLIICGEKSIDGDTAQVGAEVAELLDIPHSYYVEKINGLSEHEIDVDLDTICGNKQSRRMKLPALISVSKNLNQVKLPTVKRKLASLKTEVEVWSFEQLEGWLSPEDAGFKGSPTQVVRIEVPREEFLENRIYRDNYQDFFEDVAELLKSINMI